jgi:hypothetical protein
MLFCPGDEGSSFFQNVSKEAHFMGCMMKLKVCSHSISFTELCMYLIPIQTQKLTSPLADLYPCHSLDHS